MYSDADLVRQISGIERVICTKQELLQQSEDFEEMCQLMAEISELASRLMDHIIKLRRDNIFHFPRIPEY